MQVQAKAIASVFDVGALHKAAFLTLLAVTAYMLLIMPALATPEYVTPMGEVMCNILGFVIFGNLGRGLATLAIVVVGVGATLGKTSWGMAITVAIGISVVFGCRQIFSALTDNSLAVACFP